MHVCAFCLPVVGDTTLVTHFMRRLLAQLAKQLDSLGKGKRINGVVRLIVRRSRLRHYRRRWQCGHFIDGYLYKIAYLLLSSLFCVRVCVSWLNAYFYDYATFLGRLERYTLFLRANVTMATAIRRRKLTQNSLALSLKWHSCSDW